MIPLVVLSFINSPAKATTALGSCLKSVLKLGCPRLACYGLLSTLTEALQVTSKRHPCVSILNKLKGLEILSPLMFKPALVTFTLSALQNTHLTRLSIMKIAFSPKQWATLLNQVTLSLLVSLELDQDCPTSELVSFLAHHQSITPYLLMLWHSS